MGAAPYQVVKERDKWAIFVGGAGQLLCEDREVAISTAERAAALLREHTPERADDALPLIALSR